MEDPDDGGDHGITGNGGDKATTTTTHLWWASASAAQLGWAVFSIKRGYAGTSFRMPLKAFCVASLLVGAGATASVSILLASGIHKVEDLVELGASIRNSLGVPPRSTK